MKELGADGRELLVSDKHGVKSEPGLRALTPRPPLPYTRLRGIRISQKTVFAQTSYGRGGET